MAFKREHMVVYFERFARCIKHNGKSLVFDDIAHGCI